MLVHGQKLLAPIWPSLLASGRQELAPSAILAAFSDEHPRERVQIVTRGNALRPLSQIGITRSIAKLLDSRRAQTLAQTEKVETTQGFTAFSFSLTQPVGHHLKVFFEHHATNEYVAESKTLQ